MTGMRHESPLEGPCDGILLQSCLQHLHLSGSIHCSLPDITCRREKGGGGRGLVKGQGQTSRGCSRGASDDDDQSLMQPLGCSQGVHSSPPDVCLDAAQGGQGHGLQAGQLQVQSLGIPGLLKVALGSLLEDGHPLVHQVAHKVQRIPALLQHPTTQINPLTPQTQCCWPDTRTIEIVGLALKPPSTAFSRSSLADVHMGGPIGPHVRNALRL